MHNVVQYKLFIFQYLSRQQNMGYAIFWNNEYFSWIYLTKFFAVLKLHTDTVHADFCSSEIAYGYRTCRFLQLRNCTFVPYMQIFAAQKLHTDTLHSTYMQIFADRNCTMFLYMQIFADKKSHTDALHEDFCK